MTLHLLLALHLLGAVVWVGGMAFALLVLRPSLAELDPAARLALHGRVFARFFRIVWHVMPIILVTGYAMLFLGFGGFAGANWAIHLMHLTGLVMAAIFVAIVMLPWPVLRAALAAGDRAGAAAAADRIRKLIAANLALGVLTVAVAAFA